jgi:hypothetical protein
MSIQLARHYRGRGYSRRLRLTGKHVWRIAEVEGQLPTGEKRERQKKIAVNDFARSYVLLMIGRHVILFAFAWKGYRALLFGARTRRSWTLQGYACLKLFNLSLNG